MLNNYTFFRNSLKTFIKEKSRNNIALCIFVITILMNFALVFIISHFTDPLTGTTEYKEIARNIALGNGFVLKEGGAPVLWRPPLYIYVLSVLYRLFENPYVIIVAFQIVLNGLIGVVIFLIGENIFSRSMGFISAVLLSAYPLFSYNCLRIMPETLYTFFLSIIMLLALAFFRKAGWKLSVTLGLFLGLATLTKASIQFLPLFFFLGTVVFIRNRQRMYCVAKKFVIVVGVMILTVSVWTMRNYVISNEFILLDTSGGYTFWIGNRLSTDGLDDDPLAKEDFVEIKKDLAKILGLKYTPFFDISATAWGSGMSCKKLYMEGIKSIIKNPFKSVGLWIKKLYRFWFSYVGRNQNLQVIIYFLQASLIVPAVFGIYFSIKDKKHILPFVLLILYFSILHMLATANVRYSVPIIPYVIILAVYGANRIFLSLRHMLGLKLQANNS